MNDEEKYLYWFDTKNPNFFLEVAYREMYSRIGYIFHLIQMVEYNIANILAIEKYEIEFNRIFELSDIEKIKTDIDLEFKELSELTFGRLSKNVKNSNYLNGIDISKLESFVVYRNYLAHNCFKEKLLFKKLIKLEDIDQFIDELNDFEVTIRD